MCARYWTCSTGEQSHCVQKGGWQGCRGLVLTRKGKLTRAASLQCRDVISRSSAAITSCFLLWATRTLPRHHSFHHYCFGLDVELETQSENPSLSSADLRTLRGLFYIYFLSSLNTFPVPQTLWSSTICKHKHWHIFLSVLSLRDFHGKLSKKGLFHSPFQPTGEVAAPTAFSISGLGAGLLLPPAPHSLERNPCCPCVSVMAIEGLHPCLTHFPAAFLLVSLISATSVA